VKAFSEFSTEEQPLDGRKSRMDDILNQKIIVTGFRIKTSNYSKNETGKYLTLQFEMNNETQIIFTGSDVLIGQMERYGQEVPFATTVKKINRYYTLT